MSSTPDKPDLAPLADKYDIVGELGGRDHTRSYVGSRKADGRDVQITVMRAAAEVAEGKAIAQFAADANLLVNLSHPNVPQVLEGRWIGDDVFALISDRIHGTSLEKLMTGERIPNARIADILADVDGVLEWARGERLAHRGVTPDGILVERGTGKVYVSLSPTDAPKTNRPDPRDDARTIGALALAMLTAKPMADDHNGTLADMRPDLPQRVVDATERVAACTINDEQPNIAAYLASIAMADAIKEGEVEVARVDAEFRAAMKAEREKWEAEQQACQLANEEQARKFAEERAEYERRVAKEREQLATARGEIDKRRGEVQQARAELDQARSEFKAKKSELEHRVKDIDRHAKDLEKEKRDVEKRSRELEKHARLLEKQKAELEAKNRELAAAAALVATAGGSSDTSVEALKARLTQPIDERSRPDVPLDLIAEDSIDDEVEEESEVEPAREIAGGIESVEDIHAPWTPIEETDPWGVPLVTDEPVAGITYEAAALAEPEPSGDRRPWAVPVAVAGLILLIAGTVYGVTHRSNAARPTMVASAPTAAVIHRPDSAVVTTPPITDSAAGLVAAPVLADSARFTALRDSIIEADAARRARRAREAADDAAAARARAAPVIIDSLGQKWSTVPPPPLTSVIRTIGDSATRARRDSARRDSIARAKPDTLVKPDTGSTVRRIR
jgi:hypothetical protein